MVGFLNEDGHLDVSGDQYHGISIFQDLPRSGTFLWERIKLVLQHLPDFFPWKIHEPHMPQPAAAWKIDFLLAKSPPGPMARSPLHSPPDGLFCLVFLGLKDIYPLVKFANWKIIIFNG